MSHNELWHLGLTWVKSNRVLILCIAAPYHKHMQCNSQDLESEALLVAFQILSSLIHKQKDLSLMSKYFRVVFRSHCIKMTIGVSIADSDLDRVSIDQVQKPQNLDQEIINEALQALTERQRQISQWILEQPTPVSTRTVGHKFGINDRTVRTIINNAIKRLEIYGHQTIRKTVQVTA